MRNWFIASAILHLVVLLIFWFGLPQIEKPLPTPPVLIPVEIAELAPMTAAKTEEKKEQPQEPKKEPPKPEPPKPPEPKPEPPKPVTPPKPPEPPKVEPKPPVPQSKPPEPKPPEPKVAESIPAPKPKPKPPDVKPKPEPPKADPMASILKNVAKLKTEPKEAPKEASKKTEEAKPAPAEKVPQKDTTPATSAPSAPLMADRLMISEQDALKRQIEGCWNVPVGARDIENTNVEIYIQVNPDRTLKNAVVVDQARMARDSFFRAVAESALRAIRNPRCSPLALPPEKYQQWQEMIFNFNPKDML